MKKYIVCIIIWTLIITSCDFLNMSPLEISSWSPSENVIEDISTVSISIAFSDDVDKTVAEKAFSFQETNVSLTGSFIWDKKDSFEFIPEKELKENTIYEILISNECEDIYGNSLINMFTHKFSTSTDKTRPEVDSCDPSDHLYIDNILEPIVITFSEPIDTDSYLNSFSLSPTVNGVYSWNEEQTIFTYTPTENYDMQMEYKVNISKNLIDICGNSLADIYTSTFFIGIDLIAPEVTIVEEKNSAMILSEEDPTDGSILINQHWEAFWDMSITFSEDIKIENIQSKIIFNPTITFTLEDDTSSYLNQITIVPTERFNYDTLYKLTILEGIEDRSANKTEEKIYYFQANGSACAPLEIIKIDFLENVVGPVINTPDSLDYIDLADYNIEKEGYFDLYFRVPDSTLIDLTAFKFSLMEHFNITSSNNSASFIPIGIGINPTAPADTTEIIARIWCDIKNEADLGIIELSIAEEFQDSTGNKIISEWIFKVLN